ncbi:MAG TPA: WxL domain-containing protein [Catenuloplanes sp.]|jgi:hypothetical protein
MTVIQGDARPAIRLSSARALRLLVVAAVTTGAIALPGAAFGTDGTATIGSGGLALGTPGSVAFTATLTGAPQNVTATQNLAVSDLTGSEAGWHITATSTQFVISGGGTLPLTAVTVPATPTRTCDVGTPSCTLAVPGVSYPYTLPAAAGVAPTATKIYNATAGTGMLSQTVVATMQLAIPANARAGVYQSTWTYSLVSAP